MALRQSLASLEAGVSSVKTVVLRCFGFCIPFKPRFGVFSKDLAYSSSERNTILDIQDVAERIVREFDFTGEDVRRAVGGFIQQMSMHHLPRRGRR